MQLKTHPLLRKKTISQIMNIKTTDITKIEKQDNLIVITDKNQQVHTISFFEAKAIYINLLKNQTGTITNSTETYWKVKLAKEKNYTVKRNLNCTCHEFKIQSQHYKNHCCSHVYTVLKELGYSSLKEYINVQQKQTSFKFPKVTNAYELIKAEAAI